MSPKVSNRFDIIIIIKVRLVLIGSSPVNETVSFPCVVESTIYGRLLMFLLYLTIRSTAYLGPCPRGQKSNRVD